MLILTEEEVSFIKEEFKNGLTNPSSLVALLFSRGKEGGYTELKNLVKKTLNITEPFKSISSTIEDSKTID